MALEPKNIQKVVELVTKTATGVQKGVKGYQDGQEIYKNLTTPEEKEIAVVTEQEAKEIVAEYKKIQGYHKSKNHNDLRSITSKSSKDLAIGLSVARILKLPTIAKWFAGTAIGKGISSGLNSIGVKTAEQGAKVVSTANETLKWGKVLEDKKFADMGGSPYMMDDKGNKHFTAQSYVTYQFNKIHHDEKYSESPSDILIKQKKQAEELLKYRDEYPSKVADEEARLRKMYKITDPTTDIFQLHYILTYKDKDFLKSVEYQNFTQASKLGDIVGDVNQNLESYIETGVLNNEKGIEIEGTNYEGVPILDLEPLEIIKASPIPEPKFTDPELAYGEIQGKFGNMNTQTNTTKKKKTNKPSFWNRFSSNQYVNISREELRAKYKAHRAREIQNDPSMEYFYSSKYQDEHQNMFGTISCSNINPSEANNFSSPVGGSFTSPFSSLSNEIAPFKIPPFLTIDDILRNPKIKEFAQNIAGNEAHKQLCSYNSELRASFQEESPVSEEDRHTLDQTHDFLTSVRHRANQIREAREDE